jgi:hypothetical protein
VHDFHAAHQSLSVFLFDRTGFLMRTRLISLVSLFVTIAIPLSAVIVDRSAITVGNKVITDSAIIRRIRLAAFQNGVVPDLSLAARREAAQRLIDLTLVAREMDVGNYVRESSDQSAAQLSAFTAEHFKGSAEAARLALSVLGLTAADLQADLAEQTDFESFVELRFLPAVAQASDQEVEEYYRNHVVSAAKPGETPPPLADSRAKIEQILANERADLELNAWLRDQRAHTRITYLESALQ